jgi:hypothetical protein
MNLDHKNVSIQIRAAVELRLAQIVEVDREDLPALSIAEIVSLLFVLHGQMNILGGFGETTSAIRQLVSEELFWRRPKVKSDESAVSAVVQ